METSLIATRRTTFARVLGATPDAIEAAVLHDQLTGETSLEAVVVNLAELLGVGKLEALDILGVSRSRKSRNPAMNVELLDRAYSALEMYAHVANLIGDVDAATWFRTPKETFGGVRPLELLETRVGLHKLGAVITALEDGAFL